MPFFQSMAVRFGVKSFLENAGIDEEAAGWIAAGASLATALVTADLHGHIAGEAVAHGVHHATGHVVSHGASHAASHVTSHAVSHGASESASHTSNHVLNETVNQTTNNNATSFQHASNLQRSGRIYGYENIIQHHTYVDVDGNTISTPFENGETVAVKNGSGASAVNNYIPKPSIDDPHNYVWAQHLDDKGHVTGRPSRLPVSDFKPWTQPSPPKS